MYVADEGAGDRVTRGIDLLAPGCPNWWVPGPHAIDVGTLDFLDLERGILGQVYGSHSKGLHMLHVPPAMAQTFGFAAWDDADNEELKAPWKVRIGSFRDGIHATPYPSR